MDKGKRRVFVGLKPSYFGDSVQTPLSSSNASVEPQSSLPTTAMPLEVSSSKGFATLNEEEEDDDDDTPGLSLQQAMELSNVKTQPVSSGQVEIGEDDDDDVQEGRRNKLNPKRREAQRERLLRETREMEDRVRLLLFFAIGETASNLTHLRCKYFSWPAISHLNRWTILSGS